MSLKSIKPMLDRVFAALDARRLERVMDSWLFVDWEERRARLEAVVELSAELERIRAVDRFSSLLGAGLIDDLIQGDWDAMERMAGHLTFSGEDEGTQARYSPLWERFVSLARFAAADGRRRRSGTPSLRS